MKLTIVLFTACCLNVCANSLAQNVSFSGKNVSLESVFSSVEKQTGVLFLYSEPVLKSSKPVSIEANNLPLDQFLAELFKSQPHLQFDIKGKSILIYSKSTDASSNRQRNSPGIGELIPFTPLRAKVLDQDGQPLVGASVTIKKSSTSAITDAQGYFSLNVNDGDILVVTYIGYQSKEIAVTSGMLSPDNTFIITLSKANAQLDTAEVVVNTGYQTLPKERATGSFAQVNNQLLNRSVSTNILDRLNGVASGLSFQRIPQGVLGANNSGIMIRGNSTIQANPNPLIVVDGFPYDESNNLTNIVNNLNPNDVESITILKDAAAASIWGARSGNGVIVITTKKGKYNQRTNIQFNTNISVGGKPDLNYIKTMSSADVIALERELFADSIYNQYDDTNVSMNNFPALSPAIEILLAKRKGKITSEEAESKLEALINHDVRDDVYKYLLQKSVNQQYAINFSGGSNKYAYYGSLGYDKNRKNTVRDENSRFTIRYENSYRLLENLELSSYLVYTQLKEANNGLAYLNFIPKGTMQPYAMLADPIGNALSIPYPDGGLRTAYTDTLSIPGLLNWQYKPLNELMINNNTTNSFDNRFSFGAKYTFLPGLAVEIKYQYQKIFATGRRLNGAESFLVRNLVNQYAQPGSNGTYTYPIPNGAIIEQSYTQQVNRNGRIQLNFNRKWQEHELVALVGAEAREVIGNTESTIQYGFDVNTGLFAKNIDYATQYPLNPDGFNYSTVPNGSDYSSIINRYISYFSNMAYTFKNKYTLSGSIRADGTNFFGIKANQRIVPLWSIGGLWYLSKEKFYHSSWLSLLKLRITYGYNGNMYNSVTAYPTIRHLSAGLLNLTPYAEVMTPGNPALRWEKVGITNIGLDFGALKNRITGSIEFYQKKGVDLIGSVLTEPTTGFVSYTGNQASIKGHGVDLEINSINTKGKIQWITNFLLSYTTDKVTAFESANKSASGYIGGIPYIGKPLYAIFSYPFAGLNPINGDPLFYVNNIPVSYTDANSNIQPQDIVYHGTGLPKYFGSFRNNFQYKQIGISFNILYKLDYFFRKASIQYTYLSNAKGGHADYTLRWQAPGDELKTNIPSMPIVQDAQRDVIYGNADVLVRKGDHIRLQDIQVSYDLHKNVLKGLGAQHIQLYLYANNLGILWRANKNGIDPDIGDQSLPNPRIISFGLTVQF